MDEASSLVRSRSMNNTVSWEDQNTITGVLQTNGTHPQTNLNSNGKDKPKPDKEDECNGDVTQDRDQLIMDVLRKIVRTCTTADKSKRPSANEIYDLLNTLM